MVSEKTDAYCSSKTCNQARKCMHAWGMDYVANIFCK